MPSVETERMRAVLFVEVNGEPYRCTLPNERMALLLQLAASLFDGQKLGLAPTTLFKFPPAAGVAAVEASSSAEAFSQFQRDRIAEAQKHDAEVGRCLTCAANHYCPKHNPAHGVSASDHQTFSQKPPMEDGNA